MSTFSLISSLYGSNPVSLKWQKWFWCLFPGSWDDKTEEVTSPLQLPDSGEKLCPNFDTNYAKCRNFCTRTCQAKGSYCSPTGAGSYPGNRHCYCTY